METPIAFTEHSGWRLPAAILPPRVSLFISESISPLSSPLSSSDPSVSRNFADRPPRATNSEPRNLRNLWKTVIPRSDLIILQNRITMATDMRAGLDTKNGLSKISHARMYFKYSKETFHFAKTTSERARDVVYINEKFDEQQQRVSSIAEATYRCILSCKDAFPTPDQESNWTRSVWTMACMKTGTETTPPSNLAEQLSIVGPHFHVTVKEKIKPLVERYYGFETSKAPESLSRNIERARQLKIDASFSNDSGGLPYRHRIIQQAINVIWFNDRSSDGIIFSNLFDPIPYEVIALVLTVTECCIDEWSKGSWGQIPFTYESYKEVYYHHLGALKGLALQGLDSQNCDPLRGLRQDLFDRGRDHAGVPRRSRNDGHVWPQETVNAACEGAYAV
ncbi:hypothetical protein BGW80DRAFT_1462524 [Lactifluus volemus]|nr:hypothetical protein BGW80DRAFT_1462524 [Lactifluus volemus]